MSIFEVQLRRVALLFLVIFLSLRVFAEPISAGDEQDVFNVEAQKVHNGRVIHQIRITGLKRTKERAVRWLLTQHEGDVFDAAQWLKGIHKLYDTTVLYNIRATIVPAEDPAQIDIDLQMIDRWTLLPFGIAQAGGGSNNVGGGIYEANFLGYFGQMSGSYSAFDNVVSYDVNYFQEFVADTDYMWGMDVSGTGTPVYLQKNNGQTIGSFTWNRQQEQVLFGKKIEPNIRLFSYFEIFDDRMLANAAAPEVNVFHNTQYRIRPVAIFGRSELTNFLEQGQEITVAPTSANFFKSANYDQLMASYKKVFLRDNTNYAGYASAGVMSRAPIPYLFHLGGYDSIRGFSTNRGVGRYYVENNLEYRPYVTRFNASLVGEVVVQGCVFQDIGAMWNSADLTQTKRVNSEITLWSEGVGLRFNFLRFAGAIVRMDIARTVTPDEGWGASFGVGQFF